MLELERALVESIYSQLETNLESGVYQCHKADGERPYLTNFQGSVLGIYNGEFSDELDRSQPYISKAQDFYNLLPPDIKALAEREIRASNPQTAGPSFQTQDDWPTYPDATSLTETQCGILKLIFAEPDGVHFNEARQAITSIDESHCYLPDDFNGITRRRGITPLTHFTAIMDQYTQWAEPPDGAMQSPSQCPAADITGATSLATLPPQGQEENVQNIATVIDFVTPGYHPLVIFDADETLFTYDVCETPDPTGGTKKVLKIVAAEKDTEQTLKGIREKAPDAQIIVLAEDTASETRRKLAAANIDAQLFDSIEGDKQCSKGTMMARYIQQMPERPAQVCFVDNTEEILSDVENTCETLQIHYNTFLYTGARAMSNRAFAHGRQLTTAELIKQLETA